MSYSGLLVLLMAVSFVAYCEIDLFRAREVRGLPRWLWAIICTNAVGGVLYLLFGKA